MIIFIIRLDNFIMRSECISLHDDADFKILLANNKGKIVVEEHDIRPLLFNPLLHDAIGYIRFDTLKNHPFLLLIIPPEEWDFEPHTIGECDRKYDSYSTGFQLLALSFSLAAWLVKDSCVAVQKGYWMNCFNNYVSISTTSYEPTNSAGIIKATSFSEKEIHQIFDNMDLLGNYLFRFGSGIPLAKGSHGGTRYISQEKVAGLLGNTGKSFTRALLKLQEARRVGDVTSKIEYGCSALEALYAISEDHKYNLSSITAGFIGASDEDKDRIRKLTSVSLKATT